MAKARGLGRGLSSLIPGSADDAVREEPRDGQAVSAVPLNQVSSSPFQPRKHFGSEELQELAQSIRTHGIIQPIVVRPWQEGYQLVAGERRYRAAKLAGLSEVPALIRPLSDPDAMEIALVENLQRRDLNPMEESWAYFKLTQELGWTQEALGERVGKSRSHIANYLRLLNLEHEIQERVADESLSVAHAKFLLSVDSSRRVDLARRCVQEGWTVKELELQAQRDKVKSVEKPALDVHLAATQEQLSRRFGTKVRVRGDLQNGRIEIPYRSVEELERILEILERESDADTGPFVV
ncbi:MAG: chromosome partitioning protein ParB [Sulfobacillus thermosulfidooxidans]|nr:MAG: chromosome partitioning protein ParB [Sulfobacillus thermosulfidooxidans]